MSNPNWIPLSESERLHELTAAQFHIPNILGDEIVPGEVHINADLLKRHADYIIGLGSLVVTEQAAANFEKDSQGSLATVSKITPEMGLPSGYQRPKGLIRINEDYVLKATDRDGLLPLEERIEGLDRQLRLSMFELFYARYTRLDSMSIIERATGSAPVLSAFLAESLLLASPLVSMAIFAAGYGLAFAGDYHDARKILGKDAEPSVLKRKRWSLFPCGIPPERAMEAKIRVMSVLNKKHKPRLARYVPAELT